VSQEANSLLLVVAITWQKAQRQGTFVNREWAVGCIVASTFEIPRSEVSKLPLVAFRAGDVLEVSGSLHGCIRWAVT
jgi:hypothetical protein